MRDVPIGKCLRFASQRCANRLSSHISGYRAIMYWLK